MQACLQWRSLAGRGEKMWLKILSRRTALSQLQTTAKSNHATRHVPIHWNELVFLFSNRTPKSPQTCNIKETESVKALISFLFVFRAQRYMHTGKQHFVLLSSLGNKNWDQDLDQEPGQSTHTYTHTQNIRQTHHQIHTLQAQLAIFPGVQGRGEGHPHLIVTSRRSVLAGLRKWKGIGWIYLGNPILWPFSPPPQIRFNGLWLHSPSLI